MRTLRRTSFFRAKQLKPLGLVVCLWYLLQLTASAQLKLQVEYGDCFYPDYGTWIKAEYWQPEDSTGNAALVCAMGIGCNGRAFYTCGFSDDTGKPLLRPYLDAVYGDSLRASMGDEENHLSGLSEDNYAIRVSADQMCLYRVFNLLTGALVYEDREPTPADETEVISISGLASVPHLVIGYHPIGRVAIGYRIFVNH